jgi:hypothetical protein
MARQARTLALALAAALACAIPAAAQSSAGPGVVVSLNGGAQVAADSLSDHFEFESYGFEAAAVNVKYPAKPGVLVDAGIGVRLWKRLGAGVAVAYVTRDGAAAVDARIPHPFLFGQPRTVTGSQGSIARAETGVHVQVQYSIEASRRVSIVLSGGPSWLNVEQELATDVQYDEAYPYDSATFRSATATRTKASAVGMNAGADLRWMFGRTIGLGALVRFTRGTVDLRTPDDRHVSVRAGGAQAGAGLRFVF